MYARMSEHSRQSAGQLVRAILLREHVPVVAGYKTVLENAPRQRIVTAVTSIVRPHTQRAHEYILISLEISPEDIAQRYRSTDSPTFGKARNT